MSKVKTRNRRRWAGSLCLTLGIFSSYSLLAQKSGDSRSKDYADISITFSSVISKTSVVNADPFPLKGGTGQLILPLGRGYGFIAEVSGERADHIDAKDELSLASYLFGVRYSRRVERRCQPFVQVLAGGIHAFDTTLPYSQSSTTAANSFASAMGGGVELPLRRVLSLRIMEADYVLSRFPNGSDNLQSHLRVGAGFVIHIPAKRP